GRPAPHRGRKVRSRTGRRPAAGGIRRHRLPLQPARNAPEGAGLVVAAAEVGREVGWASATIEIGPSGVAAFARTRVARRPARLLANAATGAHLRVNYTHEEPGRGPGAEPVAKLTGEVIEVDVGCGCQLLNGSSDR